MPVNLLDLAKAAIGKPVIHQIGGILGEDEGRTSSAVSTALPVVLGGLVTKAQTNAGLEDLNGVLDQQDDGILDNLEDLLGGDNRQHLMELGAGLPGMIYGNRRDGIVDLILRATDLDSNKVGKLLSVLAPIVLAVLARQRDKVGLDTSGLGNLLASQKEYLASAMPAGFGDFLGLSSFVDSDSRADQAADTVSATGEAVRDTANASGSLFGKLLPLALLFGLGIMLLKFLGVRAASDKTAESDMKIEIPVTSDGSEFGIPSTMEIPASSGLTGLDGFKDLFGGLEETLGGVADEASAEAALPNLTELNGKLESLSVGMGNLPSAIQDEVKTVVGDFVPKLQGILEKLYEIPGVKDIVAPVIGSMQEKFLAITG